MRTQFFISVFLFITVFKSDAQSVKVDYIIYNAQIITLDDAKSLAQAVAISHDRIVAVGSNDVVLKLKDSGTIMINADRRTVIPGLYDSHLHVIRGGRFYNAELRWDGVTTLKKALQMLKEQASRTPKGQWVRVVGGWNEYQFEEKRLPTLAEINEATGNVPAFILYLYTQAFINKTGLTVLGINGSTPNPNGGLIQKDTDGQPTGVLIAEPNAFILYSTLAKLPELSTAEKINSTRKYLTELNSLGVTSVMDAGGGFQNFPDDYKITDSLSKLGQLTVRLPYYLFAQKPGAELQDYQNWIRIVDIDHQEMKDMPVEYFVEGGGENLVASGADFENFNKPRPELSPLMEKQLKEVISQLVKNKWPFRLHATYNETISRFLNVIEEVNLETPLNNLPWFFDHAETVSEENLNRIKVLNGGISIQNRMAFQGESFVARYGKQAALQAPPIRKMIQSGIRVGAGTDGTRVSSYNPWISLYWLVTGKTVGGKRFQSEENQLDRISALKLFTKGSASLIHQDKDRGMVKDGYLADLVILNRDYLKVGEEQIKNIRSVLTMVGGNVVFGDGAFAPLAPKKISAIPMWSPVNFYGGYQYK
jgi:predicted amidohydrolase YtcJ